jgi:hypothetical protein
MLTTPTKGERRSVARTEHYGLKENNSLYHCRVFDAADDPHRSGVKKLRIDKVIYQLKAAGDYHL